MNRERSRHRNGHSQNNNAPPKVREVFDDIIVEANENNFKSQPIDKFEEIELPDVFFDLFKKNNYVKPTKIQSIAIPIALESFDIIGVAKTGSGKTLSFVLPILMAIDDEKKYFQEKGKVSLSFTRRHTITRKCPVLSCLLLLESSLFKYMILPSPTLKV